MACKKAQQRNINPAVMWGAVNTNNVTARKGKRAANSTTIATTQGEANVIN
jgi:hypothetical protein